MQLGKNNIKRITLCSVLIALAFALTVVERAIPFAFNHYGIKLGLANIVVLFAIYKTNYLDAFIVCVFKICFFGILFGGPVYFVYSLSGGLLSFVVMLITNKKLNIITVSVLGSLFFNIGQILCASIMLWTTVVFYYLPYVLILSVITGILIGLLTDVVIKRIKI